MPEDAILLVSQETAAGRETLETHADRLRRRSVAADVRIATYETEPVRELRDQFAGIDADRVFALPARAAHTHKTTDDVPAALSYVPGVVHYCEPVGQSPAITDVVASRANEHVQPAADASLVLVGFGSSSQPFQRQTVEYHAARLREQTNYGEVVSCYLLQNPAVECVRYNVTTTNVVAVPLFFDACEETDVQIPAKLELNRGGVAYADPLGTHPGVTDAIHAEFEKQRVLATSGAPGSASFEASLARTRKPLATDGEGR